jgi:NAD(P)-dependent dehydrogenase (short-subunit alcohol dehydrogenase family)
MVGYIRSRKGEIAVKKSLKGKVALVAGATRGAGRGIACMLGERGATVYCSGRSTREHPCRTGYYAGRPETVDETAEMVTRYGGAGIPVRTDHLVPEQVEALVARIGKEQKRLDILVNDISEGEQHERKRFWELDVEKGFRMLRNGIHSHILTSRYAVPLMLKGRGGLIVEIGDGDTLGHRGELFYDLIKVMVGRLAFAMAEELHKHRIAALCVTPGFLRSEAMLDHFGVTEANWRDAVKKAPNFLFSETPYFVGRAVAALACDPDVMEKSGGLYSSWVLSREYKFKDMDGSRPDFGRNFNFEEFYNEHSKTRLRWTISTWPKPRKKGKS